MTTSEVQNLKILIFDTGQYYGRELKASAIQMMASDIEDLEFADVEQAFQRYRRLPSSTQMPLPCRIRAMIEPQPMDQREVAIDVANRILAAVKRYQYDLGTPTWKRGEDGFTLVETFHGKMSVDEVLLEAVGPIGHAVCRRMNWRNLVDEFFEGNHSTLRAHLRDSAIAVLSLANGKPITPDLMKLQPRYEIGAPKEKQHEVTHRLIANETKHNPELIKATGATSVEDMMKKLNMKAESLSRKAVDGKL